MAFHVACPITCRKICNCALGFRGDLRRDKGKNEYLEELDSVERFLRDQWLVNARGNGTVQVRVPKVAAVAPPLQQIVEASTAAIGGEDAVERVALEKRAAAATIVGEDCVRKIESGDLVTSAADNAGEEQGHSNADVMCRLCSRGENEGSERARKMLSCNCCGKKYHRSCVKAWSQSRDLFHWSSWTCPSCRTCEVCHRTGDPNKLMFCKRCDAAYHCYCQQPPHKNVGHGPYLCPKHTKCHSCSSSVAGNGVCVRWFLGYTCCDACGRLFVKNNYCPVCLKVYRDSESTPMVCCDVCQKWVHCTCDGISDAKYDEFQVNENLQYVCPTCRRECCEIRSLEEAVQELWRRRDEAERDLIASLRAAAGLPTEEEIFGISPFSDDEDGEPEFPSKEDGRSLKFYLEGVGDRSPRKSKKYGKKSSKKKYSKKKGNGKSLNSRTVAHQSNGTIFGRNTGNFKNEEMQFPVEPVASSPATRSLTGGICSVNEAAVSKHKDVEEVTATYGTKPSKPIKIKSTKNINQLKDHEGIDRPEAATRYEDKKGHKKDRPDQLKASRLQEIDSHLIKLKNANPEGPVDGYESNSLKKTHSLLGRRGVEDGSARSVLEVPASRRSRYSSVKYARDKHTVSGDLIYDNSRITSNSQALDKDHRPHLKFKLSKSSNSGNQSACSNQNPENLSSLSLPGKDEITYTRGQRSKRKSTPQRSEDNTIKDFTDANWILQKLGKDAAGKRVEIHQASNNSWHRGTVNEVFEGTSIVSISLDDGKAKNFELGKQGIRFVPQKQKR